MARVRGGFTGTQTGMTHPQAETFAWLVLTLKPDEFHHGDCVGADAEAHAMIRDLLPDCVIVVHPPENEDKRAFCKGDVILDPLPYLKRNQAIVTTADVMLSTPKDYTMPSNLRGQGTWSTINRSIKTQVPIAIIYPNGTWNEMEFRLEGGLL